MIEVLTIKDSLGSYQKHIKLLDQYHHITKKNKQKETELTHISLLLLLLEEETIIHEIRERPDFILNSKDKLVGLEHSIIIDQKLKQKEGHTQTIADRVEKEFQTDNTLPNFFASCQLHSDYLNYEIHEKPQVISMIKNVIKEYIHTDRLIKNPYIKDIHVQPHDRKSVGFKQPAWWQADLTPEILIETIKKKEKKLEPYKTNIDIPMWLLLVISTYGESSFDLENENMLEEIRIESKFEKIFILKERCQTIYVLK